MGKGRFGKRKEIPPPISQGKPKKIPLAFEKKGEGYSKSAFFSYAKKSLSAFSFMALLVEKGMRVVYPAFAATMR